MKRIEKIYRHLSIPTPTKVLLLEGVFWSVISQIAISILPLKYYRFLLVNRTGVPFSKPVAETDEYIRMVRLTVRILSNNAPWKVKCYSQAIVAKQLLQKKGLNTTLKLGLAKDEENQLQAHAWLLYENRCTTGGEKLYLFTPIAEFR